MAISSYLTNKFYHVNFKEAGINFEMGLWQNVVPEAIEENIDKHVDGVDVDFEMVSMEYRKILAMYICGLDSEWANQKIVDHVKEVVDNAIESI